MACSDCTPQVVYTYDSPYGTPGCNQGDSSTDSNSIIYSGAALSCSTIATGDSVEKALQKIDTKLCAVLGDYSTYNTHCLTNITTEKQFVEAISQGYCTLNSNYTTFTGTTYIADKATLNSLISANNIPNITSSCTSIFSPQSTDTVKEVLQKLSNTICTLQGTTLDLSSVNWGGCYTVTSTPITIQDGFNEVLTQICAVKSSISSLQVLPTFDNSNNCLSGTSADSLTTTIGNITTKLCSTPSFDINALTWNCVVKPTTTSSTDLQKAFQAILSSIDSLKGSIPTFSSDFITTPNGCAGTAISLGTTVTDNKVASTSSDTTPGTLEDKVSAGTNISLDFATTPGKMIISSQGGSNTDEKVKATSTDPSAGYLLDKLEGDNQNGISTTVTSDTSTNQVKISADYDPYQLLTNLFNTLNTLPVDDPLFQLFCTLKNKCQQDCGGPSGVQLTYITDTPPPSSTTTTTTTTRPVTNATIYWDFFTSDPGDATLASLTRSFNTPSGTNYIVNTSSATDSYYFIVKEPSTEPVKTTWYSTTLSYGTIPDQTWNSPVVSGGFRYYKTRGVAAFDTTAGFQFRQ